LGTDTARRALHRDKCNERYRQSAAKSKVRVLLAAKRYQCRKAGLPFDLTPEDIVIPDVCPVLGIPIYRGPGRARGWGPRDNSPSIDRFVASAGYVRGNVRVISYRANRLRCDATVEELEKVLAYAQELSVATDGASDARPEGGWNCRAGTLAKARAKTAR
jgi:hypothetical protein